MEALLPAMLALGLASGLHCVGMCGGIVAAFSARRVIPIADAARPAAGRLLVFNAGRLTTYAALGAAAGAAGGAVPVMQGRKVLATVGVTYFTSAVAKSEAIARYVPPLREMARNIQTSVGLLMQGSAPDKNAH